MFDTERTCPTAYNSRIAGSWDVTVAHALCFSRVFCIDMLRLQPGLMRHHATVAILCRWFLRYLTVLSSQCVAPVWASSLRGCIFPDEFCGSRGGNEEGTRAVSTQNAIYSRTFGRVPIYESPLAVSSNKQEKEENTRKQNKIMTCQPAIKWRHLRFTHLTFTYNFQIR